MMPCPSDSHPPAEHNQATCCVAVSFSIAHIASFPHPIRTVGVSTAFEGQGKAKTGWFSASGVEDFTGAPKTPKGKSKADSDGKNYVIHV